MIVWIILDFDQYRKFNMCTAEENYYECTCNFNVKEDETFLFYKCLFGVGIRI